MVPEGTALSYKDVAELIEYAGPRQIGRIMAVGGITVPWWGIVRADGSLPGHLFERALPEYERENTPLKMYDGVAARVDMKRARWVPTEIELEAIDRLAEPLHVGASAPDYWQGARSLSEPGGVL